jgi:prepilin-type N-terminal cleavage/methylation domain-containing protein
MNKSFTLIEILVVIVVIGVLSAFILVGMSSITSKANISKSQAFSNSLRNSLLINLVSEWKLNETSGITVNDSWGLNSGTWYTGAQGYTSPSWRTSFECVSNGCLAFDGLDDFISIPDADTLDIINAITIEAWIKLNAYQSSGNWSIIVLKGGTWQTANYYLMILSDGKVRHIFGDGTNYTGVVSVSSISLNSWNHIVVTRLETTAANQKIYINGQEQAVTGQVDRGYNTNNGTVRFSWSDSTGCINGLLDDIRIYNQAIPTSEIQNNYFVGINKLYKNGGLTQVEFNQRLVELKSNLASE